MFKILGILVSVVVLGIIILVGHTILTAQESSWIEVCIKNNWKNFTLHGDYAGEFDCQKYWKDNYANGKWAERCSVNYFLKSTQQFGDCHTLCNIDCEFKNKNGGSLCVC